MANLGPTGFDASVVEPTTDFDPLPAGKYVAEVTASDMRPNSKGTGEFLWLEFSVLDGPYAGRKVWAQLNLVNPSQQAVEIAQRELSALCRAVGKLRVQDSIELHNCPVEITLKVRNDVEFGPSNTIRGYKEVGGKTKTVPAASPQWKQPAAQNSQSAGTTMAASTPPAAPAVNSPIPPWKKR